MSIRYIPGCCCDPGYIFVVNTYITNHDNLASLVPQGGPAFVYLEIYSQTDSSLIKRILLHEQEPTTGYLQGYLPEPVLASRSWQPVPAVVSCSASVVGIAYSLYVAQNTFSHTGREEENPIPNHVNFPRYESIHKVCFVNISDLEIMYQGNIEVEDPSMIVSYCCMNRFSELYVGFEINRRLIDEFNVHYGYNGITPTEERFEAYIRPQIAKDCPIVKIKWDGEVLETIQLGYDSHGIGWQINDMFVNKADKLLVCLISVRPCYRTTLVYEYEHEILGTIHYDVVRYHWPRSCLKTFPDEKTYYLDKSPSSQAGVESIYAPVFISAFTNAAGDIFVAAKGYTVENIYPDDFVDFPEDAHPELIVRKTLSDLGTALGQVAYNSYTPYWSMFKHNGGEAGDYTDWNMLLPRIDSITGAVWSKTFMTPRDNIIYASAFSPVILPDPLDQEHFSYPANVDGKPYVFRNQGSSAATYAPQLMSAADRYFVTTIYGFPFGGVGWVLDRYEIKSDTVPAHKTRPDFEEVPDTIRDVSHYKNAIQIGKRDLIFLRTLIKPYQDPLTFGISGIILGKNFAATPGVSNSIS